MERSQQLYEDVAAQVAAYESRITADAQLLGEAQAELARELELADRISSNPLFLQLPMPPLIFEFRLRS